MYCSCCKNTKKKKIILKKIKVKNRKPRKLNDREKGKEKRTPNQNIISLTFLN